MKRKAKPLPKRRHRKKVRPPTTIFDYYALRGMEPEQYAAAVAAVAKEIKGKDFRTIQREFYTRPEVILHMRAMAMMPTAEGIRLFTAGLNKAYPTPMGHKFPQDQPPALNITIGAGDRQVRLDYQPMGRVPGMDDSQPEVPA